MSGQKEKPAEVTISAKDVQVPAATEPTEPSVMASGSLPKAGKDQIAVYATENVKPANIAEETKNKEVHLHQINIVLPEGKGEKITRRDVFAASALKGALSSQFDARAANADVVADACAKYADALIAKLAE